MTATSVTTAGKEQNNKYNRRLGYFTRTK